METPTGTRDADPQADLAALEHARDVVRREPALAFGPVWYAPAIAAILAGIVATAWAGPLADSAIASAVVYTAAIALLLDDARRTRLRPRLSGSLLVATAVRLMALIVIAVAWMVVQSLLWLEGVSSWIALVGGWVVVTAVLLLVRRWLERRRVGWDGGA